MSISSTGLSRHELHGAKPITVTVATAKKLSGLGNTTLWALIKEGKLEPVRIGRRTLVTFSSLEALLAPGRDA
jgi:excisionase family DNA binding protein